MAEIDYELARFFAWARERALQELETQLEADPTLDPNWTFSDIMQRLLEEYRRNQEFGQSSAVANADRDSQ